MRDPLPNIPTPLTVRWREFRVGFLPALVFGATVAVIIVLWRQHLIPTNVDQARKPTPPAPTVVAGGDKTPGGGKS